MAANDCCGGCCCGPEIGPPGQPGELPAARFGRTFRTLGITQISLGTASILCAVILLILAGCSIDYSYGFAWASSGIWSGAFFVAAGILGTKSATYPSPCTITAAMVVTIFAALTAITLFSLGIAGAVASSLYYYYYYDPWYSDGYPKAFQDAQTAFHSFLAIIGFIEMIVAITHSSYCCAVSCCRSATVTTTQTYVTTIPAQGPVLTVPNQQGVPQYRYVVQGQVNPGFNQSVVQVQTGPGMSLQQIPGNQYIQQPNPGPVHNQLPPQYSV